jgi:uncharacterized protein YdaU (DUF1376 family)
MSLPYYRFFPGDYDRDTRHLSMLQHGAYRLLIDAYMVSGPLPNIPERLHRLCGAFNTEERGAIEFILVEFFVLDGPLWHHKRCDSERNWQLQKSTSAKESVGIRWKYERTNERKYERNTNQNQNQNQNQRSESDLKTLKSKSKVPNFVKKVRHLVEKEKLELPDWLPLDQWRAYLEMRTRIRKPATSYAQGMAIAKLDQLREQGHHPAAVLGQSIMNAWQGLFALKTEGLK